MERGCGTRVKGGVYAECELSQFGQPLEAFVMCPPVKLDFDGLGVTPVGVKLVSRGAVWHIVDWVGSTHYPNVADFLEEVRRFGVSRRLSRGLDFAKLTPESRLLFVHARAWIEYYGLWAHDRLNLASMYGWRYCPKKHPHHESAPPELSEPCAGLWWDDVQWLEGDQRLGTRKMPSFAYSAGRGPQGQRGYAPALFASFPISNLAVVRDRDGGTHEDAMQRAAKSGLDVVLVEE